MIESVYRKRKLENGSVEPFFYGTLDNFTPNLETQSKQFKWSIFLGLLTIKLLMLVTVVSLPFEAHAGVFSFVSEFFGKSKVVIEENIPNSQTMALLQAAVNPDPNPSKGGGEITIVGSALLPETGPSGTLADIEEHHSDTISIYVVREGDTLGGIAEMFGVSVNTIMWANEVKSDKRLLVGQTLIILPVSGVRHTIKKGDTIESLATKYKADASEIVLYNDLARGASLAVGEIITIPDAEIAEPKIPSTPTKIKGNGPSYAGYYMRPVAGGHKSQGLHGYNGVDLADSISTPIMAAANGVVIIAKTGGWNTGYGNYVVISHGNGTQTLYGHNSANLVTVGQTVKQGQAIALMGSTGKSTGSHVHFEIRGAKNPF